ISRQLWWGHQIPAWYGPLLSNDIPDDGKFYNAKVFVAETEEEALEQAREYYNKHSDRSVAVEVTDGSEKLVESEGGIVNLVRIRRDEDVLDTWFSSALWPFSTLGWPEKTPELGRYYPTDVLVTGFDIIFFWVARMMMMGLHFMGDVPFRTVYVHALVRDEKGQKMSKSKGNVMDPLEITGKYGADALRFTLTAMAAQGRDIRLSEERIAGYRSFATKIWNATRYCEMNGCLNHDGFDPAQAAFIPNQWIIGEVAKAQAGIDKALAEYRFNDSAEAIYRFVYTFCDWYLEFTKPLLQENGPHTQEIRQTTAWVLHQILILLNPFMPFITEEIFAATAMGTEGERLINSDWPEYKLSAWPEADADMGWLMRTISEIRSVRKDRGVPDAAKIPLLVKDPAEAVRRRFKAYEEIVFRLARIETIEVVSAAPKGGILQTVVDDTMLILPVAGFIDIEKEKSNIEREIQKAEAEIAKIDKQLGNEKFVANAPAEIVDEQRSRRAELDSKRGKLTGARDQLG
ncbi:MAG: class I tRNA ligase family protein, partial [Alphaproteobacteria bacterium]|nr:class I tRNA ligase family protein [Alphaproteobacteria bacterium]